MIDLRGVQLGNVQMQGQVAHLKWFLLGCTKGTMSPFRHFVSPEISFVIVTYMFSDINDIQSPNLEKIQFPIQLDICRLTLILPLFHPHLSPPPHSALS